MPKEKEFKKVIPRIYKCNAENLGLFFFIKAQLQTFPTMTLTQGVNNYRKFLGLTIDDWDDESMLTTYMRMQRMFYNDRRNECTEETEGASK